jgi:hypothetical protein
LLAKISQVAHKPMPEILSTLPDEVIQPAIQFPAFREVLQKEMRTYPEIQNKLTPLFKGDGCRGTGSAGG